jgi:hypothetical protein
LTADKLENIGSPGSVFQINSGFSADANVGLQVWIKKISSSGVLRLANPLTANLGSWDVDFSTLSADWELIDKYHAAVTINNVFKANGSGQDGIQFTGSGDVDFYVWGNHEEEGSYATSNIETGAAVVTRNRDQLDYDNTGGLALPNSFTLIMTLTPKADGADYLAGEIRTFGSEDDRGPDNAIRTYGGADYAYSNSVGGGIFTLKAADLSAGVATRLAFSVSQETPTTSRATIWKDGTEKLSTTKTQVLDHTNQNLTVGYYSGGNGAFNIKYLDVYRGRLSDPKSLYLTSL